MKQTLFILNHLNKYFVVFAVLFVFSFPEGAMAQQLTGTVQDKDNNPIADATVILEPLDTNLSFLKIKSDEKGSFFMGQIRRGKYYTKVSKEGYALYHLNIDIQDKKKKSLWKFNAKILSDKDLPTVVFQKGDNVKCTFTIFAIPLNHSHRQKDL